MATVTPRASSATSDVSQQIKSFRAAVPPLRTSTNIQGNILAAFNKDIQLFRLLRFTDVDLARYWLSGMAETVSRSKDVEDFNERFSAQRKANQGSDPEQLKALWVSLSLTSAGLQYVAVDWDGLKNSLQSYGDLKLFLDGAAGFANDLGDKGDSDPKYWKFGNTDDDKIVHAIVVIAADDRDDLSTAREEHVKLEAEYGIKVVLEQPCDARLAGREHFGFKDGVSQPGVWGFHSPDPKRPDERLGKPGTKLVKAGEFVFGYVTEDGRARPAPTWMNDGSLHVIRRLEQDVNAWNQQLRRNASQMKMDPDLLGALLVGRFKDGTPLAECHDGDNDFDFGDDPKGLTTPCVAHIRKTYPRAHRDKNIDSAQNAGHTRHRIMRRGVSYGPPYRLDPDEERGMMFTCYCTSLRGQFGVQQGRWSNSSNFRAGIDGSPTGIDAVSGTDNGNSPFKVNIEVSRNGTLYKGELNLKTCVTTTGSLFAFTPSINTLRQLGRAEPLPR
ncbi:peroxidase [Streptomyces misionensis]|uniref:Peroxidase n=1 Tax=Streptomyces misionensis TaxID=67331 RepID=A0A5C6K4N2_9ACTN|nr:Dyp-type peroxidase domain-containing protein [Streptomyces misionensis]TWV57403.1 peroxidase [Streptomyces misionensis]